MSIQDNANVSVALSEMPIGFASRFETAQETRSSISIQDNVYVSGASFGIIMGFVSETAQETRSSISIQENANVSGALSEQTEFVLQ